MNRLIETLVVATRLARRAAYDMGHAAILFSNEPGDAELRFEQSARDWVEIFQSGNENKDWRIPRDRVTSSLQFKFDRLAKALTASGLSNPIEPKDVTPERALPTDLTLKEKVTHHLIDGVLISAQAMLRDYRGMMAHRVTMKGEPRWNDASLQETHHERLAFYESRFQSIATLHGFTETLRVEHDQLKSKVEQMLALCRAHEENKELADAYLDVEWGAFRG